MFGTNTAIPTTVKVAGIETHVMSTLVGQTGVAVCSHMPGLTAGTVERMTIWTEVALSRCPFTLAGRERYSTFVLGFSQFSRLASRPQAPGNTPHAITTHLPSPLSGATGTATNQKLVLSTWLAP